MNLFSELKRKVKTARLTGDARTAYAAGRIPEALAHARALYGFDTENPWANFLLACHHLESDRYTDALPHLQRLSQDWPQDAWTFYAIGVCFDRQDQPRAAIPAYRQALEAAPDWAKALKNLGRDLYLSGDYGAAEETLTRYCEMQPDDKEAHDLLGYLCYRLGKYTRSFGHYERARLLDPLNPKLERNARLLYTRSATS